MANDKKNKEDYVEINEDDIEILGEDGIYRKYEVYKRYQNKNKMKLRYWLPFITAVIYTLSPIDLIPDRIPIGKLDDIILLAITLYYGLKKADFSDNPIINVIIMFLFIEFFFTKYSTF